MRFTRALLRATISAFTVVPLLAVLLYPGAVAEAATARPLTSRDGIALFCPCWGGVPANAAAWDAAARNMRLIAGPMGPMLKNYARAHEVNPDIVMLPYTVGPYLIKDSATYKSTLANHPDRFARTADGKLINVPAFPKNVLMDVTNPGWQNQQAQIAKDAAEKLDGVYVDSMGPAPTKTKYTSGRPADPATGQNYTPRQWLEAGRDILNRIKALLPDKYVLFNGLSNGSNYALDTHILAESNADGAMSEAFMRGAKAPLTAYPSLKNFQKELDEVADTQARGLDFFAWTKTWASGTEQQREDWNTFALASYLLVNEGRAYYNFLPANGVDRSQIFYANQQADIGSPLGPYTVNNGVYRRSFSNGQVVVNPGAKTAAITVSGTPGPTSTTTTTEAPATTTTTRPCP